ncbi:hypothetical protein MLD38_008921 [Melastoma candidum]|uniref:Uncharacterized protein n=1 Tax=Melastoma candidum TaxID=119954 RepID=A0ACB9RVC4_9MYRT|nr:hypothetical protein MLD38_008921 [Melastoma candidum]
MPGIALKPRETPHSRGGDQMCRHDSQPHLTPEEEAAAEESLACYCKPVELYNILQRRSLRNSLFLQRCLGYKIQAKNRRRIQMRLSLSGSSKEAAQYQRLLPMFVLLARLDSEVTGAEYSAEYRYSRARLLISFVGSGNNRYAQGSFLLPDISKLELEAKRGSLSILIVSYAGPEKSFRQIDMAKVQPAMTAFLRNAPRYCLMGRIPMESFYVSLSKSPNLRLGQRAEVSFSVDMYPCLVKLSKLREDRRISVQNPCTGNLIPREQVRVVISAEEVGCSDRSPYTSYLCSEDTSSSSSSSSSLYQMIRLRDGNVIFNYRYFNNKLQRTEVTEDFTCPFCLVKCASFKGLRCHLSSSHDLFTFEFWITEEYQAVNVSLKTEGFRPEIVDDADPRLQTFFFCSKPFKCKRSFGVAQNAKHVYPLLLESEFPSSGYDLHDRNDDARSSQKGRISAITAASGHSSVDADCAQSVSGNNLAISTILQFSKTRKLYLEQPEPKNHLLQKRQFFHSHRAQPMAAEQVMSDRDSEDEIDDDVADIEDRRMLDDFVDVTKDEKRIMHLWNSFVRKQRVLADSHIPWHARRFQGFMGPTSSVPLLLLGVGGCS